MITRVFRRGRHRARCLAVPVLALCLLPLLFVPACDRAPLLAPTETTLSLFAGASVLALNSSTELIATVIEQAGTPVQNGTVVLFTTNLGSIDPAEARTEDGRVTARLHSGAVSGTATLAAISGAARSTDVQIQVGGTAVSGLLLTASPGAVPASGGTVTDPGLRDRRRRKPRGRCSGSLRDDGWRAQSYDRDDQWERRGGDLLDDLEGGHGHRECWRPAADGHGRHRLRAVRHLDDPDDLLTCLVSSDHCLLENGVRWTLS